MGGDSESAIIVGSVIGGCCFILICWLLIKWIQEKRKEKDKKERRKKRKNRIRGDSDGGSNEPIVIHANGDIDPKVYGGGPLHMGIEDGTGLQMTNTHS